MSAEEQRLAYFINQLFDFLNQHPWVYCDSHDGTYPMTELNELNRLADEIVRLASGHDLPSRRIPSHKFITALHIPGRCMLPPIDPYYIQTDESGDYVQAFVFFEGGVGDSWIEQMEKVAAFATEESQTILFGPAESPEKKKPGPKPNIAKKRKIAEDYLAAHADTGIGQTDWLREKGSDMKRQRLSQILAEHRKGELID